eukprot:4889509-Lingulodinium_polyedra.AAC.1
MARLNRRLAAATAWTSHARALHARANFRPAHGTHECFGPRMERTSVLTAVRMLFERSLNA